MHLLTPRKWLKPSLDLFPQNYHEPYYVSYTNEDFSALATSCGLTHIRDVKAFVSKVMVFDKPARRTPQLRAPRSKPSK